MRLPWSLHDRSTETVERLEDVAGRLEDVTQELRLKVQELQDDETLIQTTTRHDRESRRDV